MKVLSIGNSFSQDAHKWLNQISEDGGQEIYAVNLYIGGCSLETHWTNYLSDEPLYDLEINGEYIRKISLSEGLKLEKWDVVTLQQASYFSGRPQSYIPYLGKLAENVRLICPNVKVLIHETWAYEQDRVSDSFINEYSSSQREMFRRLRDAYTMASKLIGAPLIPVGRVVQYLRENCPEFDYKATGRSLCRDGYHLDLIYGRFAAALTWYGYLTDKDVRQIGFVPYEAERKADGMMLDIVKNAVHTVLQEVKYSQEY